MIIFLVAIIIIAIAIPIVYFVMMENNKTTTKTPKTTRTPTTTKTPKTPTTTRTPVPTTNSPISTTSSPSPTTIGKISTIIENTTTTSSPSHTTTPTPKNCTSNMTNCNNIIMSDYFKLVLETNGYLSLKQKSNNNEIWSSAQDTSIPGAGPYTLKLQKDGNLVIYDSTNFATWASKTNYKDGAIEPYTLDISSGQLGLTDGKGTMLWYSNPSSICVSSSKVCNNTIESDKYKLILQLDGNLVLYRKSDQAPIWATMTDKGRTLVLQSDGKLSVRDGENISIWTSSNSGNTGPYKLDISTGNVIITDKDGREAWKSENVSDICISSPNGSCNNVIESGDYKLELVGNGDLILKKKTDNSTIWSTNITETNKGPAPYTLRLQSDGNLAIYNSETTPRAIWNSGAKSDGSYKLNISSGAVVIIDQNSGNEVWRNPTMSSATTVQTGHICNQHNKCLATTSNSSDNDTYIIQNDSLDVDGQWWTLDSDGYICNRHNKCLASRNNLSDNGNQIVQWSKLNENGQKWSFEGTDDHRHLKNGWGKYLGSYANQSGNDAWIIQWDKKDEKGQKWKFV